jgi:hypothetical protein
MNERELETMALLCAPAPTDDLKDIEFDDTDEAAERNFIKSWIQEERAYQSAKMRGQHV